MGNIIAEGAVAARIHGWLRDSESWSNAWLTHGLEHLGGDEGVHINFGKVWSKRLVTTDRKRFWAEGKENVVTVVNVMAEAQRRFGLNPAPQKQIETIWQQFDALVRDDPGYADGASAVALDPDGQPSDY